MRTRLFASVVAALAGVPVCVASLAETATTASSPKTSTVERPAAQQARLDLKVPNVNRVLTPAERQAAMGPSDTEKAAETVEVQRQRDGAPLGPPKPPGGLGSVFWAFAHPVQAWRIFFPVPPEQRAQDEAPRNN